MPTNQKTTSNKRQREQDQKERAAERASRRNDRKARAAARLASGQVGPQIAEPSSPEEEAALDRETPPAGAVPAEPRPRPGPGATARLYVGNLSFDTDADALRQVFDQHGAVTDVHVVLDPVARRPRGFAFVTMGSPAEAQGAMGALDGQVIDGRAIRVSHAEDREPRRSFRPGPGRGR